jgi:hypothetical protein
MVLKFLDPATSNNEEKYSQIVILITQDPDGLHSIMNRNPLFHS